MIPTFTQQEKLQRCVKSVLDQSMPDLEVIVVNNGGSPVALATNLRGFSDPRLRVAHLDKNSFFCAPVNHGVSISSTPYIATLNDDAWLDVDWAKNVVSTFEENVEIGSVSSLVLQAENPDRVDSAGNHVDLLGRASNLLWNEASSRVSDTLVPVFSASSSCAAYRRDAWNAAGGLDNDFTAYFEDIDLGFRMQLLGMPCLLNPRCRTYHHGASTSTAPKYKSFLIERNRVWNIVKNFPTPLLKGHALPLVLSNLLPVTLQNGRSVHTLVTGKSAAVVGIHKMLQKRIGIQRSRRIPLSSLEALLSPNSSRMCKL
ncbi:glycosyltransferase family 2 protein [Streptomyces sp. NPDC086082]|uniref:glycosyltransferase family 2 protein n=1 Tax=Streptomyces sp. NPDC086082 TaxID=3365750 RepID=UPI00380D397E